ncbi:MAG TPA: M3 family metallopeptidase [Stellaceae bacterium]|nr:M3 family metallopeptidase [Stellaceae bacterium]
MSDNPFFADWTAPFGLPPFDAIRPEHFPPAFDRFMAEQVDEVAAIAHRLDPPRFDNTIAALERGGRRLNRTSRVFFNLNSSAASDALEAIARDYAPKLARHRMRVALDPELYRRIAALYAQRDELGLDPDQRRLVERRHLDLVRSGAKLGPTAKARMAALAERLATLHTLFGQNVLHDEKTWHRVLEAGDLDGLPDFVREAAAAAARERGLDGRHVVTLARSSVEPFLAFAARRDLRQAVYEAWTGRGAHPGAHDNMPLIREILALRAEQARLLGYDSYAAYRLDDTMAKDIGAVERLLDQVWAPAKRKAEAERAALQALAREDGLNAPLAPWDWRYYAEKLRRAEHDLDAAAVKPYFALDAMVEAAFDTARRLFGVRFEERTDLPAYHPDVRVYAVSDAGGHPIGLFLHDNFARPGKRSGAWMSSYQLQESFDSAVAPIVVNNNNFAKAAPTLLDFDEAETLFHEFGHGLHGLLSRVRYPSQSGTSVRRDFVEFPSQIFEHWLAAPETLRRFARHHATGAPLPEALLRRIIATRTFNQGFATVEYVAAAMIDLALHTHPTPEALDVVGFERELLARIAMPAAIDPRHRSAHFQHLFAGSGYAAGYYAYLWAETLDADGFDAFAAAGDLFDRDLAARLASIYAAGDTVDPMELYVAFRGREPTIDALLQHRGLVADAPA